MRIDATRLPRTENSVAFPMTKPGSIFSTFRTFYDVDYIRYLSAAVDGFARLILPRFFRQNAAVHGAVDRLTQDRERLFLKLGAFCNLLWRPAKIEFLCDVFPDVFVFYFSLSSAFSLSFFVFFLCVVIDVISFFVGVSVEFLGYRRFCSCRVL